MQHLKTGEIYDATHLYSYAVLALRLGVVDYVVRV